MHQNIYQGGSCICRSVTVSEDWRIVVWVGRRMSLLDKEEIFSFKYFANLVIRMSSS
jgi:hypothetical protein